VKHLSKAKVIIFISVVSSV